MNFKGKIILISGASRGIGRAIAEEALRAGATVIGTSTLGAPAWSRKYKHCRFYRVDFLDRCSLEKFLNEVAKFKRINALVNNAGMHIIQNIDELDESAWDKIITLNLKIPVLLTRAVIPVMREKKTGHILNISSIAGLVSKPGSIAYSSSKSGLIGLTRSLALSLAEDKILVNALCPGYTQTDMIDRLLSKEQIKQLAQSVPLGRLARPEEIAWAALFLISDLNTYITGQTLVIDGGEIIK